MQDKKWAAALLVGLMLSAQNGQTLFETVKTALEEAGYCWKEVDVRKMPEAGRMRFARGPQGYFDLTEDENGAALRLAFCVDHGQDGAEFLRALGEKEAEEAAQALKTRYEESRAYHKERKDKRLACGTAFSREGDRYYELEDNWLYATFRRK